MVIRALAPICDQKLLVQTLQSLLELVNSTARIYELLLTGKEGMALGTNFNSHFAALGASCGYGLAACALDDHFFILRMNTVLHFCNSFLICIFHVAACQIQTRYLKSEDFASLPMEIHSTAYYTTSNPKLQ